MPTYSKWITNSEIRLSDEYIKSVGANSVVLKTLIQRGYLDSNEALTFINPEYYKSTPGEEIPGLEYAVNRIYNALENKEYVCIWGDLDIESQSAVAILFLVLQSLNIKVFYCNGMSFDKIPNKSPQILSNITDPDQINGEDLRILKGNWPEPSLLIICGAGLNSHKTISLVRGQGVDVIIADDDDLPHVLPDADVIVNPKFLQSYHPLFDLSVVGVVFKVVESLSKRVNQFVKLEQYLDIVAIGILADFVRLRADSRYLLQRGLTQIKKRSRVGIDVFFDQISVPTENITEEHIRYLLIPRLNALARSSDVNMLIEFFLTENMNRARVISYQMENLYQKANFLVDQGMQAINSRLIQEPFLFQNPIIFVPDTHLPINLFGTLCSRLINEYKKPVILISDSEDQICRGLARSVDEVNILTMIKECKDMVEEYDGHSSFVNFSINKENINLFSERILKIVARNKESLEKELLIDAEVLLSDIDLDFIEDIERLAPFGSGNPYLTLVSKNLNIRGISEFGRSSEHLSIEIADEEENQRQIIWWRGKMKNQLPLEELVDIAYRVRSTDLKGRKGVYIDLIDIRKAKKQKVKQVVGQKVQVIDYRQSLQKFEVLVSLSNINQCKIYAEGEAKGILENIGLVVFNRYQLKTAEHLVIWSSPVSQSTFIEILKNVNPDYIYLFDDQMEHDRLVLFMKKLSGYIKYALRNYGGWVDIQNLAANTNQRESAVRKGIELLIAKGDIDLLDGGDSWVSIIQGEKQIRFDLHQLMSELENLIQETNAFKSYYRRMPISIINELIGNEESRTSKN